MQSLGHHSSADASLFQGQRNNPVASSVEAVDHSQQVGPSTSGCDSVQENPARIDQVLKVAGRSIASDQRGKQGDIVDERDREIFEDERNSEREPVMEGLKLYVGEPVRDRAMTAPEQLHRGESYTQHDRGIPEKSGNVDTSRDHQPRLGPVIQYLGDNESHPAHLVGSLKHQARAGKQTSFSSEVLMFNREKYVNHVEATKWSQQMETTVEMAQTLSRHTFYGTQVLVAIFVVYTSCCLVLYFLLIDTRMRQNVDSQKLASAFVSASKFCLLLYVGYTQHVEQDKW